MTVWIVIRNGVVDRVFGSKEAAEHHRKQLTKRWAITDILEREVELL